MIDLFSLVILCGAFFAGFVMFGLPLGYLFGFAAGSKKDEEILDAEVIQ